MNDVTFITGNQNKADYQARLLGVPLAHQKVDLDELQSMDQREIVDHKVRQAYAVVGSPVLVEDVSLGFTAIGGLPGPFIKFFMEQPDGPEKLCRMLDGFDDRSATAQTTYGYYDGVKVTFFTSSLSGTIAQQPTGEGGWGWDVIFCPDGYDGKTRAQLTPEQDAVTYRQIKPFGAVKEFLQSLS